MRASEIINRLALHLVEMAVPPCVAALVAAEASFLTLCDLLYLTSAILTTGSLAREYHGRFWNFVPIDIVPAAERLHRVQRYSKRLCNPAVAVPGGAQVYDLCFLIIGHIPSAPSEG